VISADDKTAPLTSVATRPRARRGLRDLDVDGAPAAKRAEVNAALHDD
jgi:hypothetical protein